MSILKNIFNPAEPLKASVISTLETTAADGKGCRHRQDTDYISDFDREIKRIEGEKP